MNTRTSSTLTHSFKYLISACTMNVSSVKLQFKSFSGFIQTQKSASLKVGAPKEIRKSYFSFAAD